MKREIAEEVTRQLRQAQSEAQSSSNNVSMDPFAPGTPHVFVANASVNGYLGDQMCAVNPGDVLELRGPLAPNATAADVVVLASTGGCPRGSTVNVGLQDLIEMQNSMRESLDRGLAELQSKQGKDGMPKLKGDLAAPPVQVSWASQVVPDQNVQAEISSVSNEATSAEQEAVSGTLNDAAPTPAGATPVIGPGSCIEDVISAFGQPLQTVDLGAKKIFVYKSVKVTFVNGLVVDVQ